MFPWLHRELVRSDLLSGVRILDFGLSPEGTGLGGIGSSELPLTGKDLQSFLAQTRLWTEQFITPHELKTFAQDQEDFFSNTSMAIRAEFMARSKDDAPLDLAGAQAAAQRILALSWALEEQHLELSRLEDTVDSKLLNLQKIIGIELSSSEGCQEGKKLQYKELIGELSIRLPLRRLMTAFLLLMPLDCFVYFELDLLKEELKEAGLCFSAPGSFRTQELQLPANLSQTLVSRASITDFLPWLGQDEFATALEQRWLGKPVCLVCDFS